MWPKFEGAEQLQLASAIQSLASTSVTSMEPRVIVRVLELRVASSRLTSKLEISNLNYHVSDG